MSGTVGDIKTFTINQGGLELEIKAIYMPDGQTQFIVKCISGTGDINALYWGDGNSNKNDGQYFNADGTEATDPFPSSLNMNGTKTTFDSGIMLSAPGLGPDGMDKSSFLTAGETLNFTLDVSWDDIANLGVRATSVNGGGSIKGVDTEPEVTEAPVVSVADALCVIEGNDAAFTISLDKVYDYDVVVFYDTNDGTATEGDDFNSGDGGSVTIKAGETSAEVKITTIDDELLEPAPNEEFTLDITKVVLDLPGDDDIEVEAGDEDFGDLVYDASGDGCIVDNDDDGGGGGGGGGGHFPDLTRDISNVTFYFADNSEDGVYTVKIDTPPAAPDDVDAWYAEALAAIIEQDAYVTEDTLVYGVAIKGGKNLFDPDKDNADDPYDQDYVWDTPNEDSTAFFSVTASQNPDYPNDPLPAGLTSPITDSDLDNTIVWDDGWLV